MISLKPPTEPIDVEVIPGVVFTCRPVSSSDYYLAQAIAQRQLDELEQSARLCHDVGLVPPESVVDFTDETVREAFFKDMIATELAVRHIVSFKEGVIGSDGNQMPVTSEAVRQIMKIWNISEGFVPKLRKAHLELIYAKKEFGVAPNGTSAAAPITAKDARPQETPAPAAERAKTASDAQTSSLPLEPVKK